MEKISYRSFKTRGLKNNISPDIKKSFVRMYKCLTILEG